MGNPFYRRTGKRLEHYRELDDWERPKHGDIIWVSLGRKMPLSTHHPIRLIVGERDALKLTPGFFTKETLTKHRACTIMGWIVKEFSFSKEDQPKTIKRNYSIWREKLSLPRLPIQDQVLPLP